MKKSETPETNYDRLSTMRDILVILPESFRLYQDNLAGIRRRIGNDWRVRIADCDPNAHEIAQQLKFWEPAGCIVMAARGRALTARKVLARYPTVFLDRTPFTRGNFLDVRQDYTANGHLAATELLDPEIDNYAFVGHKDNPHWSQARGQAFSRAIRSQGKRCHVFEDHDDSLDRLARLGQWLTRLPKPIGIFTANDTTAAETHAVCTRLNISMPEEVSLLGIDDDVSTCEAANPAIASIHPDFEMAGWLCADLLCERLGNPRLSTACRHYSTLGVVRRGSLRFHIPGHDAIVRNAIHTIRARACEGLLVDDVAAAMNCSRRMAEIRFQKATNRTIKSVITEVRLDRANILLKNRTLSFDDVARACGYGTTNALRIALRKNAPLKSTSAQANSQR